MKREAGEGYSIHNGINLNPFVILDLIRNPGFFWIPAFTGMTDKELFQKIKVSQKYSNGY
jgi:hypothetical protein